MTSPAAACVLALALALAPAAAAQSGKGKGRPQQPVDPDELTKDDMRLYKRLSKPGGSYARVLFTSAFGRGLRFNNPYRLKTQLGDGAESLSLTPTYFDLAVATVFGDPDGFQHGAAAHLAVALEGVPQQAVSLSYLLLRRGASPWLTYGRLGLVVLTTPDANVGGELAGGLTYFFTGAVGATLELVGNLYYGAATYEAQFTVIPTVSLQGGLMVDFEVLP